MKKIFILTTAFFAVAAKSQILTNSVPTPSITETNVILDASTNYSAEAGETNNRSKGIVIPSVDLVNFEFILSKADGVTFRTYFDGMIVYNRSTGNTLTTGNRPSTSTAVSPGFYYFYNPNGAINKNIKGGQWRPMGNAGTDTTNDAWVNDTATNSVKLASNADGTARAAGTDFVAKDNGSVGIGTDTPNNSALLDLTAPNKGILVPRVALTSVNDQVTIPSPATGLMVYNTGEGSLTYKGFVFWNGTEWRSLNNDTTVAPSVAALNCSGASIFPLTFVSGVAYSGTLTVPYSGGNGGSYAAVPSFTQNGLTFTLNPGSLNYGNGTISYSVSGVPNFTSPTSIPVPISFLGTNCSVSIGQNSNFSNLIYVRKTVPINASTPTTSITTIGNISVRYNGTGSVATPQFRINSFSDRASVWMQKAGTGDNDSASFALRDAKADVWTNFSDNFNPGNRDSAVNYISLFGRNEIYRVSFVGYPSFSASGEFPAVTSSITIFIEKLE